MISKATVAKLLAGTTLIGGLTFGTLKWAGSSDIEAVQNMYNRLYDNYQTALGNISVYKNELARRKDLIDGANTKQQALQQRIDELEAQLEQAQGGSEEDKALIADLEQQIADLQAQLDDGITDEQYNQLLAEIERLQGELTKANSEVATLKEQIAAKDASITDIEAVTAEEVQAGTDIADLFYTFAYNDNSTDIITEYFTNLQLVDELNESPVTISERNGLITIGNMRAYKKLYDSVNGAGAFDTDYKTKFDANTSNTDLYNRGYNVAIAMKVDVTINGRSYVVQWNDLVTTTPGGTNTIEQWINQDGSLNV